MSVMALRSSSGWRSTMSISLSPSRILADRGAGQDGPGRLGDGLAGHAQRARLGLVHLQAQHLDRFVPVVVHAAHVRALAHDGLDLVGALAQHQRVVADHAELHRIRHRRAVGQQLDAPAHLGNSCASRAGSFTRSASRAFRSLRQHDELRLTLVWGKIWSSGR
jgi:hypothetical protein